MYIRHNANTSKATLAPHFEHFKFGSAKYCREIAVVDAQVCSTIFGGMGPSQSPSQDPGRLHATKSADSLLCTPIRLKRCAIRDPGRMR